MRGLIIVLGLGCVLALAGTGNDKVRVYVTDSTSWSIVGTRSIVVGRGESVRPTSADIIKTFREKCPELSVTMKPENADYLVVIDRARGLYKDKIAVYKQSGDVIYGGSARKLTNAVKDACKAIQEHVKDSEE